MADGKSREVDLDRRRIAVATAMALLGGASVTITGCSGGGSAAGPSATPPPPQGCPAGASCGEVSADALHRAVITAAALASGSALILDIQGTQTHGHVVSLSAQEVVAIRDRQRIEKVSTFNVMHSHTVTFN
jgi:hypothetical protein